jgi:PadR family transcriptional regulator, regulatory protein PadR
MAKRSAKEPIDLPKDLVAASAVSLVLGILARGESYGYAILARVRELSGGRLEWKDGMLYPVLHRMEHSGWVVASLRDSEEGRRRRYYRITAAGRRCLAEHRQQWVLMNSVLKLAWEG